MQKLYTITMSNGDLYGIPAEIIAKNRADYYQYHGGDYRDDMETMMHWYDTRDYEFVDWAKNNMDWDDVKEHAILLKQSECPVDYQEDWVNGKYGFACIEDDNSGGVALMSDDHCECGMAIDDGWKYCPKCGGRLMA